MGYSIYLENVPAPAPVACPTCGHAPIKETPEEPDCPGPTYNLTAIFDLALTGQDLPNPETPEVAVVLLGKKTDRPRGLRLLNGRRAADTVADLEAACTKLSDGALRSRFEALQPSNGWGSLDDARNVMSNLLELAREYPDNVWRVR